MANLSFAQLVQRAKSLKALDQMPTEAGNAWVQESVDAIEKMIRFDRDRYRRSGDIQSFYRALLGRR